MRPFASILAVAVLFALCACGQSGSSSQPPWQSEADRQRIEAEQHRARIESAWAARLDKARNLSVNANLLDDRISCDIEGASAPMRSTGNPRADRLALLSELPLVVFIAHGFEFRTNDGSHTHQQMRSEFANLAAIAQAHPGASAVCYVSWRSLDGISAPSNQHLAKSIAAVRELAIDPLVAMESKRRIVLVGYSVGGNYVKRALVDESRRSSNPSPRMRFLSLGTPHVGSPMTNNGAQWGRAGVLLMGIVAALNEDQESLNAASNALDGITQLENSQGYLEALPNNATLNALNEDFANVITAIDFFNFYSPTDNIVPPSSATWSTAYDIRMDGFTHSDFQRVNTDSEFHRALYNAMSDQNLGGEASDPAPDPYWSPTP